MAIIPCLGAFCLVVDFHQGGSVTKRATQSSFFSGRHSNKYLAEFVRLTTVDWFSREIFSLVAILIWSGRKKQF